MSYGILEGMGTISKAKQVEKYGYSKQGTKKNQNFVYFMCGGLKNLSCFHEVRRKVYHDGSG